MRHAALIVAIWFAGLHHALAQTTNPAPPTPETGPAGSSSMAATGAAMDFNWVWVSALIAVAMGALWLLARRRQSGPPPHR